MADESIESVTETDAPGEGRDVLWMCAAVFALAFSVRAFHVLQLRSSVLFDLKLGDARSYHDWALRIAGGDWLGSEVFYQAPLYPYFLAVTYSLFGDGAFAACMLCVAATALAVNLQCDSKDAMRSVTENNIGIELRAQGRIEETIAHYEKSLEFAPGYALAHTGLGLVLRDRGQSDLAKARFVRAIELQPDYAEPYDHLGNILLAVFGGDIPIADPWAAGCEICAYLL